METILILAAMFGIAGISWLSWTLTARDIDKLRRLTSKSNETDPVTPPSNRWS